MEVHSPDDLIIFKKKALQWAASFETACYFDSNGYADSYSAFDVVIAAGASSEISESSGQGFEKLKQFSQNSREWMFGFLSYDLKNETENLYSANEDQLDFPDLYFFKPQHFISIKGSDINIISQNPSNVFDAINNVIPDSSHFSFSGDIKSRFSPAEYKATVREIKEHIKRGDIYETNFCQEFYAENCSILPLQAFNTLNEISPTPFAAFFKIKEKYIISASPERFLRKRNKTIISQPIKGTSKRSADAAEDKNLRNSLRNSSKEQAENVMIVDLVRNDLTKCAVPGSVKVEELFGIYSFGQVHQMISTVSCVANPTMCNVEIIESVFPMGSMTGAPKISAMTLMEKFERSKRGVYSGAIGYFAPNGDFDFNVVIRTLLYNADRKYLSYHVGSAITFASQEEDEYNECILKAQAILSVLASK